MKDFYKKTNKPKTFFAAGLPLRTTAFGQDVLKTHLDWMEYFYARWKRRTGNFLLSEQGDIGGNPVRVEAVPPRFRAASNVQVRGSDSYLPPLWYRNYFFETDREGSVRINGMRCDQNIGMNLKAWGIMSLPDSDGDEHALLVLGTPGGRDSTCLCLFGLSNGDITECRQVIPLGTSLEPLGKLVCFGRHVFIVHNGRLVYFYYSPEMEQLEQVPIGKGPEDMRLKGVVGDVVADGVGNVFWIAGNEVYGFRIGSPSRVTCVGKAMSFETVRLLCTGFFLFVYRREADGKSLCCEAYRTDQGNPVRLNMQFAPGFNMVVGIRDFAVWYLKIPREGTIVPCANNGSERAEEMIQIAGSSVAFCLFGSVIPNARYAGYDEQRNIVVLQR